MSSSPESAPDPDQLDPLRLVYLLVLDSQGPPDLLVHLDPSRILECVQRLYSSHSRSGGILEAQRLLMEKHPDAKPQPLWRAWMEATQGPILERLQSELLKPESLV